MRTLGECRDIAAEELIFSEGEPADSLFVLEAGLVLVVRGDRELAGLVRIARPGSLFGEDPLFRPGPRQERAKALVDCRVREIRAGVVPRRPAWPAIAGLLYESARDAERHAHLLANYSVEDRLRYLLAGLAEAVPGGEVPLSQADLADLAGTRRETVNTALGKLEKDGLLERGPKRIAVPSPARLRNPDLKVRAAFP